MTFLVFVYCFRENDLQLLNNSLFCCCVCGVLAHFTLRFSEHISCQQHKKLEIIYLVCNEILN